VVNSLKTKDVGVLVELRSTNTPTPHLLVGAKHEYAIALPDVNWWLAIWPFLLTMQVVKSRSCC